jgi:hypothetical protein
MRARRSESGPGILPVHNSKPRSLYTGEPATARFWSCRRIDLSVTLARMDAHPLVWKRCSTCKKEIAFTSVHWVCNVSTCNRTRTALAFCSVACWDAHVPMLRHREAWAEERRAPTRADWERQLRAAEAKERRRSR